MTGGKKLSIPPELREEVERKSPEERRKIEQVWTLLEHLERDAPDVPGTDEAWADLTQRIASGSTAARNHRRAAGRGPNRHALRRMAAGAAALVCVLALGVWLWRQPVTVVVPAGAQHTVTLPDGSTAHLNSTSRLQYHRSFQRWPLVPDAKRRVTLEGEAFFDVVHMEERPFVVETFNAHIEVLGTQFNVRARQGQWEGATQVTLASGRVRVSAPAHPDEAMLLSEAGQTARVGDTTSMRAPALSPTQNLEHVLVWRKQGFVADNQPLASILAEVERRYALALTIDASIALTDSMSIFYPRGTTAERIIHDLCLSRDWRYRAVSGGFSIFPADSSETIQEPGS